MKAPKPEGHIPIIVLLTAILFALNPGIGAIVVAGGFAVWCGRLLSQTVKAFVGGIRESSQGNGEDVS